MNYILKSRPYMDVGKLEPKYSNNYAKYVIFKNNIFELDKYRMKISEIKNWDKIKKMCNPYELINISGYRANYSIAKFRPLSRSYFKMIEIINLCNLSEVKQDILCLAEGPGGFIQALHSHNKNHKIIGVTLPPISNEIPSWNKLLEKKRLAKNVIVKYCDLCIPNTLDELFMADLITADGGIDYSEDQIHQEQVYYKIIFCEIACALRYQKKGGTFVLKIVDITTILTLKMIYILTLHYEMVNIVKLHTSRPANAEKYLVCKNFRGNRLNLSNIIDNWKEQSLIDLENIRLPADFIHELYEYNKEYTLKQIESLSYIIDRSRIDIMSDDYNQIIKYQCKKAIEWCNKNNIEINENSPYYIKYISSI